MVPVARYYTVLKTLLFYNFQVDAFYHSEGPSSIGRGFIMSEVIKDMEISFFENKFVAILLSSLSKGYAMEILLAVTFSFDHPNQSEFNNVVIKLVEKFMNPPSWVHDVGALPFGDDLLRYLPSAHKNNLQPLIDTALQIVASRKNDKEKKEVPTF